MSSTDRNQELESMDTEILEVGDQVQAVSRGRVVSEGVVVEIWKDEYFSGGVDLYRLEGPGGESRGNYARDSLRRAPEGK